PTAQQPPRRRLLELDRIEPVAVWQGRGDVLDALGWLPAIWNPAVQRWPLGHDPRLADDVGRIEGCWFDDFFGGLWQQSQQRSVARRGWGVCRVRHGTRTHHPIVEQI